MSVAYLVFFILSFIFCFHSKAKAIFYIPIILIIFDVGMKLFADYSRITFYKAALICIIILFSFPMLKRGVLGKFKWLFAFLIYCGILLAFSSEFAHSFKNYFKLVTSMMFLPISFSIFNDLNEIRKLVRSFQTLLIISCLSAAVGYVFGIGQSLVYGSSNEEIVGLMQGGNFYPAAIAMVILISCMYTKISNIKKILIIALITLTYVFILLTMRRTAIALPLIGFIFYGLFGHRSSKLIKILGSVALLFLITLPLFHNTLVRRYEIRKAMGRFENDFYESEMRYVETTKTFEKVFSFENLGYSLFGKNIFASGWNKGKRTRMLHTDHATILDGTGLIGMILYILLYVEIYSLYRRLSNLPNSEEMHKVFKGIFIALYISSIAVALNGSIFHVTYRTLLFTSLGAILGVLKNSRQNLIAKRLA